MRSLLYIFLSIGLLACNTNPPHKPAKNSVTTQIYSGPFDLAKLKLTEDLPALMAAKGIKAEPKTDDDVTMLGYEVFKSSKPEALRFGTTDFSGSNGKNRNYIIFHYNEENKELACYSLILYDQKQTNQLINLLGNVAKLTFKRTHLPKGLMAIDENGDEVKPENAERKTYRVWEDNGNGITYYLSEDGSGDKLIVELIALKKSTQFSKDWIKSNSLDWYKNEESEPLD